MGYGEARGFGGGRPLACQEDGRPEACRHEQGEHPEPPMNQQEAEKALSIIRQVIQNTREDLVAHNWGLIWLIHAFINLAACLCGWYVESQGWSLLWYLVPLAVAAALNLLFVVLLLTRDQGVRSFVEWQMHGIWIIFIVF